MYIARQLVLSAATTENLERAVTVDEYRYFDGLCIDINYDLYIWLVLLYLANHVLQ